MRLTVEIKQGELRMSRNISIEYPAHISKEGDQFIAHAMPLDVMSSGQAPNHPWKALDEAVHLFLVTAADMGTVDDILQEAGYELRASQG